MSWQVREATPADVPVIVAMVHELAEYEKAADECHLTADQLDVALFGPSPALYGHVALDASGVACGFALWFLNYSTWRGVHGIHLEDLYVRPALRKGGAGRALVSTLARICVERGYGRLEWNVLDWNEPARAAYHALGAAAITEWVPYRVDGETLTALGRTAPR